MTIYDPPHEGELELTLIGPGYGEAILVHFGSNRWLLVDSCIDSNTKQPASLQYLRGIGVEPADSVECIIASHWDDDHIKGLADVISACPQARFCCSAALSASEFVGTVTKHELGNRIIGGSGVNELYRIYHLLSGKSAVRSRANQRLYRIEGASLPHGNPCEVWALSPSDKQLDISLMEIAELVPTIGETRYRATARNRNHLSVALWITVGDMGLLLGGDLEETKNAETGWSVIVDSTLKPSGRATVFKVPHHGSGNGHNAEVWDFMLYRSPYCVLTPFQNGSVLLPTRADVKRIGDLSENAFVSSVFRSKSRKKRHPAVEKTLCDEKKHIRSAEPTTGVIRLRKSAQDSSRPWNVELFGPARPLSKLYH